MLQDNFGRRFHYLRLSVTDVCNFRCNYCLPDGYQMPSGGVPEFLSRDEIAVLVSAFAALGTSKVRLTGGEPSLRRDLSELIATCKQTPGIRRVAMTTNGYQLHKKADEWLSAGLDAINVSIDSLDPQAFQRITGHDCLKDILAGIRRVASLGIDSIKVNAVMLGAHNGDALGRFLDWLRDTPVTVRFIELMRTGDNAAFFRDNRLSGEAVMGGLLERGWREVVRQVDAGPARELWHPEYAGRLGFIMPYSQDFCASCNRLRVSATGKVHLCLFATQGNDVRDFCRRGDVDGLVARLQHLVGEKEGAHHLHDGYTGATRHLAMLGG